MTTINLNDIATLAAACQSAYSGIPVAGYTIVDGAEDQKTGLSFTVFKRNLSEEYIFAFRGTESAQDLYADLNLGLSQWTPTARTEFAESVRAQVLDKPGAKIHFTGHSLGGALAQYAAYEYAVATSLLDGGNKLTDAFDLVTFNALGGTMALQNRAIYGGDYDPAIAATISAAHYKIKSDVVSRLGIGHVGSTLSVLDRPIESPLDAHFMDNFVDDQGNSLISVSEYGSAYSETDYLNIHQLVAVSGIAGSFGDDGSFSSAEALLRTISAFAFGLANGNSEDLARLVAAVFGDPSTVGEAEFDAWVSVGARTIENLHESGLFAVGNTVGAFALAFANLLQWGAQLWEQIPNLNDATGLSFTSFVDGVLKPGMQLANSALSHAFEQGLSPVQFKDVVEFISYTSEWVDKFYSFFSSNVLYLAGTASGEVLSANAKYWAGKHRDDHIMGLGGDDIIIGGKGTDYLNGGAGADRFCWYSGDGEDYVVDFDDAGDRIVVNDLDLSTLNFKRLSADSPYYVDSTHSAITLHYDGGQLTIDIGDGRDSGRIVVTQFTPGANQDYGIKLNNYVPAPIPVTDVVVAKLGFSDDPVANQTDSNAYYRELYTQRGINWAVSTITFDAPNVSNYSGGSLHGTMGGAFEGGPVDDSLVGNANQNALHGLAGDDRIEGRDGDDFLEGGAGADRLFGGAGNDVLFGSARAGLFELNSGPTPHDKYYQPQVADAESDVNVLAGDSGNDFISGGEYQDYMDGGTGGDRLLGGTGADFISGGADTDFIYGDSALDFRYVELTPGIASERFEIEFANGIAHEGDYNDVLHGGDGVDALWGEVGDDELYGENGNDNLFGDRVNIAEYFAAEFPAMAGTTPDLDVAQHGNDKLFGGAGRDLVQGMGGNDELTGGTEDDDLDGGAGNDAFLFEAGDGRDRIRDTQGLHNLVFSGIPFADLRVRFRGADVFVGRVGTDEGFFLSRAEWSDIRLALETPDGIIERSRVDTEYYDGAGNLLLRVKGTNSVTEAGLANVMTVDAADPERPKLVIKGGIEGVRLEAIAGGAGGGRVRVTSAGMSFDTELSAYLLQSGGEYLSLANGQALAVVGFSGVMPASSASDWIVGSESADTMSSGNGNDVLDGRGGNDMLDGGDGSDFLAGGNGDDRLSGGQSTNYFDGGRGSDTLIGGATYDSYRFIAGDGTDTIVDGGGQHGFDFGAGVTPASVALYYTSTTDTSFRLQYGQGDAIVSQGGTAAHWISSVKVNGAPMSLVQRSDLVNGTFRDTRWHDTFEPGAGDDTLFIRGWGNDVLRLAPGGGQDVVKVEQDLIISPLKGAIQFAAGIDLNTITFSFSNADAVINYGTGNKVTLDTATVTSPRDNTLVRFTLRSEADSNWFPVIRAQGSSAILYGTYGKDRILGGNGDDTILPGYGDDIVEAGAGEDRVVLNELYIRNATGGIGHKSIRGGGGNDVTETPLHQGLTFHYDRGDGNDFIMYDWSYASKLPYLFTVNYAAATAAFVPNGEDALSFGAGIALADLRFVRYGDSLAIQLKDGSGSIRITDFFHAWDAVRGPNVGSELLALVGDSRELDGDTLLHPTVLAALPRTPIASLKFQDGSVVALAPVLESQLEQGVATVLGTEGDDYLHGTEVDEIIHLLGGDDYFDADEGSNTIDAGKGDDTIDVEGSHIIVAGEGDDDVTAMGNNIIDAGAGRDTVWVSGDNFVDPGAGIDWITLRGGHNVLRFGPGYGDDSFEFTVRDGLDSTVVEMAEGLTIDDLLIETFFEDGGDIIQISLPFTDDVLTLRAEVADADGNGFSRHPHATVTAIRFSDGSEITGEELFALNPSPPTVIQGTNGIDWLAGTEGNEDFYGGRGNDLMYGAGGNDYFYIEGHDQGEDRIVGGTGWDFIFGGEGADTITLTDFLATDSVEKIDGDTGLNAIAGTAARNVFDFTGTALLGINHIDTRAGDDDVRGSHGNDVFVGGLGNDIVRGVGGNDIYLFGRGHGRDSIANYAPLATETDCLWLYDIAPEQLWFSQSGFDLLIDVVGTSDQVRVINWYYTEDRQLDTIYARDQVLQRNQVQQLVNAMAAFDAPTGAGAVIPPAVQDQLEPTLAAAWHLAA